MKRILVIQTAYLGDTVLTFPALHALRRSLPGARLELLARPGYRDLVEETGLVHEFIPYDKRGSDRGMGFLRVARLLRSRGYDGVFSAHRSLRSALLAWLTGAGLRVGFGFRGLYNRIAPYAPGTHEFRRLLGLLEAGGLRPESGWINLSPGDRALEAGKRLLGSVARPLVVIAPSSLWPTKRWPWFGELARGLLSGGAGVAVVGLREEATRRAREVEGVVDLTGKTDLVELWAVISLADCFVSGDTGPGHLAALAGVPQVVIMGPTSPELGFLPVNERLRVAQLDMDCRPCGTHGGLRCPLGHHRCMRDIKPRWVQELCEELL